MMKSALTLPAFFTITLLTACSDSPEEKPQDEKPQEATVSVDQTMSYDAVQEVSKAPGSSITKDGDWMVVSRIENGNRVYWFIAPDINKVSPALYKKTVHLDGNNRENRTVSKCDAPAQTCDKLMKQFKEMSNKYN